MRWDTQETEYLDNFIKFIINVFFQIVSISDLIIYVFLGNLILEHIYFLSSQFIASTIKKLSFH